MKRFPWITLALAGLAVAVHRTHGLTVAWQFDRAAFAQGEWWRLMTAHLTHFGADHLRWDLLAFVILGGVCEWIDRRAFAWTLAVAAPVITAGVGLMQPWFTTYRGLSGIDSALFGLVIAHLLVAGGRQRDGVLLGLGGIGLLAFAGKCAYEIVVGDTLFVASEGTFAPVPLAHLLGLLAGAAVGLLAQAAQHAGATDEDAGDAEDDEPKGAIGGRTRHGLTHRRDDRVA